MRHHLLVCLAPLLMLAACPGQGQLSTQAMTTDKPDSSSTATPTPPVAKREAKTLVAPHGHERVDEYYWLREREDPEVLAYLEAENAYTKAMMAHTSALQTELQTELAGRIKQDDSSVPVLDRGYYYYTRWQEGADYPLHCRKRGSLDAEEEVLIDVEQLAEGHDYYSLRGPAMSDNQMLAAFAIDDVGRRIYTLRFKDIASGELLPDAIPEVTGSVVWAADNNTVFYSKQDLETLRSDRIYRHVLGTDPASDELVYHEQDETFRVGVSRTSSREYLVIHSAQTMSDEARILEADNPMGEFRVFAARERGHEYRIDHLAGDFYIRTNLEAKNFRVMRVESKGRGAKARPTDRGRWVEVVGHREDVMLEGFRLFRDHLVTVERHRGLNEIHIRPWAGAKGDHVIDFGEPTYSAYYSWTPDPNTTTLRYRYSSLTTPNSVFDYDMNSREKTLRKQTEVVGEFDPADYRSERIWAKARDGVEVPISLVYHEDTALEGKAPLLLYAYGSYGSSTDAYFSPDRLSLLDRGFVFAIAHVRGGEELGRAWYEDGKLLNKKNSFTDFIDCGTHLVEGGYADPERLYAYGGSAGGLLIGAVINMAPERFSGAIAAVPFVDVVTTMLDDSIPLTTNEYDEWGNPNDPKYYEYMLSYSPYDNVEAKAYPALLVTTGLHDSQVQYWEPAKWVAKLRAHKHDQSPLLLRTNMSAGHGGKSGRLRRYDETAFKYAFLLDLAGMAGG